MERNVSWNEFVDKMHEADVISVNYGSLLQTNGFEDGDDTFYVRETDFDEMVEYVVSFEKEDVEKIVADCDKFIVFLKNGDQHTIHLFTLSSIEVC